MWQLGYCVFWFNLFQIEKLKKDIEAQNSKKSTVEARAGDADKKVQELNAKLEKVSMQLPWFFIPTAMVLNFFISAKKICTRAFAEYLELQCIPVKT